MTEVVNKNITTKKILFLIVELAAFIAALIAIYSFINRPLPHVSYIITNEVNVFDINKKVQDLKIYFKNEDLGQQGLNLKIYTIRVQNDGDTGVRLEDYDPKDNWGIRIDGGKIIESRLTGASSDYISKYINPKLLADQNIYFNQILFDKNAYFDIDILVLLGQNISPNFIHFGKIAGINDDSYVIPQLEKGNQSFLEKIFYGNPILIATRFIVDVLILILLIVIVGLIISGISFLKRRRRIHMVDKYKSTNSVFIDNTLEYIFDLYIEDGAKALLRAIKEPKNAVILLPYEYPESKHYQTRYNIRNNESIRNDFLDKAVKFIEFLNK